MSTAQIDKATGKALLKVLTANQVPRTGFKVRLRWAHCTFEFKEDSGCDNDATVYGPPRYWALSHITKALPIDKLVVPDFPTGCTPYDGDMSGDGTFPKTDGPVVVWDVVGCGTDGMTILELADECQDQDTRIHKLYKDLLPILGGFDSVWGTSLATAEVAS